MKDTTKIEKFYSDIQFPGHYTSTGLQHHVYNVNNPYLKIIDKYLDNGMDVLDVGCGSGLISNLFALRYPKSKFKSIDFSDAVKYAKSMAIEHNIKNVTFQQKDYTNKYPLRKEYDVVICQGVLHHIPDFHMAAERLMKNTKPGGFLIVGLYHPAGKILKKFLKLDYGNKVLYKDQEENPFELSFTVKETLHLFKDLSFIESYPKINMFTNITALLNYRSGGLITYVFQKKG